MTTYPYQETASQLHAIGFNPLPIVPGTKRPAMAGWQRWCAEPMPGALLGRFAGSPIAYGIGLALGWRGLVCIDVDSDDAAVQAIVREVLR
jgi:hypothetical protein